MLDPNNSAPPVAPTAPAPTVSLPFVEPTTQADLSPTEALQMAEWTKEDLAKGKISAEQAERIFADLNTPLEQRLPDARSAEEKALDQLSPVAKPDEYRINYFQPGDDATMTPELKTFDQTAPTWLSDAGFPKETGKSLVSAIAAVAQKRREMTAEQLEAYGVREFERLQQAHGPALEERLQTAGRMVGELDTRYPGLRNLLKSRGIGDNALVANMLISQASIYHERRKGR